MSFRRLARLVVSLLVGAVMFAAVPVAGPSAMSGAQESSPRDPVGFTLGLVEGSGELEIRGAEEPYLLQNTTAVSGSIDDGAITGGDFVTPQVHLEQDISSPISATAFIDADFDLVTPESGVGSLTHEGVLTFKVSLAVDVHVDVQEPGGGQTIIEVDCRTSPVNLSLETVPGQAYTEAGRRVRVSDPNFSIPPVIEEPACNPAVSGEINNQLAGSGHSLALTLEGDMPIPPPPQCPTTMTLTASPADEAVLGTPVDLTAMVAPDPSHPLCIEAEVNGDVMEGPVEFFDGATQIGSVQVAPDGTAVLTTSTIPAGTRSLTAKYSGLPPFEGSATTEALPYRITPNPTISSTLPDYLLIGGAPSEFDVRVANTGFGRAITNGRFDITLSRSTNVDIRSDRVLLEYLDPNDVWVTVPMTPVEAIVTNTVLFGSIGLTTGFALPIDGEMTQRLRIRALTTGGSASTTSCDILTETCPGPMTVTVELVEVDGVSGEPAAVAAPAPTAVAASSGAITLIEATRRATTVNFGSSFSGGPISPYRVRQGATVSIPNLSVAPNLATLRRTGFFEFELNGQPLAVRRSLVANAAPSAPPLMQVPVVSNGGSVTFDLPLELGPGAYSVKVKYLGDAVFAPSENTTTLTIVANPSAGAPATTGVLYDCLSPGAINARFRGIVESTVFPMLPAVRPAGSTLPLPGFSLKMLFSRDRESQNNGRIALAPANGTRLVGPTLSIDLGFGPGGSGTAAGLVRANGTTLPPPPAVDPPVDETITFQTPTASTVLNGSPGDVVPVTLDEIHMAGQAGGIPKAVTCTPLGAPVSFGSVTLSGHELTVEPGGPIREGGAVTLSSAVEPYTTGQVEYRAGSTTIGVVPVVDGLASTVVDDLPPGVHTLTGVFSGGFLAPAITSNPVEFEVIALHCASFAEEGHGAVVRLVYMRLLGRCPDQAGYDHWVARLEGGTSRQHFARAISQTAEARRKIANDGYQTMLGREGDPGGLAYWAEFLNRHPYRELLAALGNSSEYWELAGGTNEGFVTRTYQRLLHREPDEVGLAYWIARLERGMTKLAMLTLFASQPEPTRVVIIQSFNEMLDRDPTPEELAEQVALYTADGNRSALYARLIGLQEFYDLAQMFPNFLV